MCVRARGGVARVSPLEQPEVRDAGRAVYISAGLLVSVRSVAAF